jgi:hypothetical protein
LALAIAACTHDGKSQVSEVVGSGRCEEAARLVGHGQLEQAAAKTQELGGTATSYGIAAAGYTADVIITGTAGIVSLVVFCPLTVAQLAACASGHCIIGDPGAACFSDPWEHLPKSDSKGNAKAIGPGLGSKALTATAGWRENPGIAALAEDMRQVAACYERRDRRDDLIKANVQLRQIHVAQLYDRLAPERRQNVDRDIARVRARLEAVAPGYQAEVERQQRELALKSYAQEAPALWRDLTSGIVWRLQTAPVPSAALAAKVCEGTSTEGGQVWQLPNRADVEKAIKHGLLDGTKNPEFAGKLRGPVRRAFVRTGEGHAVVELTSGEFTARDATEGAQALLCMQ